MSALEPEPPAVTALFGDRADLARSFTARLAEVGEERGLIGPLEPPRLWTRHVLNSVLLAPLLRPGRVGDVGSGAGLPGIPLAIARPDVDLVLIEPMVRRTEWLQEEVDRLGLVNVEVIRGRAEDIRPEPLLDQVTARAVASLARLVPMIRPLVRSGGELLLLKGARVDEEIVSAAKQLRSAHVRDPEVLVLGEGILPEETRVFRATVD